MAGTGEAISFFEKQQSSILPDGLEVYIVSVKSP
jgi:hypothetical protein